MNPNLFIFFTGLLCLVGCGIESTVPSDASSPSQLERAVFITDVQVTATGSVVTCELNEALVAPGVQIPIFLEFQGSEVQRTILTNQAGFTFTEYNPPANGNIRCVVEFADAEFESEAQTLTRIP